MRDRAVATQVPPSLPFPRSRGGEGWGAWCSWPMPRSAMLRSSTSSRSSRWLPPMMSPIPGASTSMPRPPELGEVAAGVRVLGTEGRAESVDLGEREAVGLDIELPRHRRERLAAKEILREIDLALRRSRQVREIERRHPEQRPGPSQLALSRPYSYM